MPAQPYADDQHRRNNDAVLLTTLRRMPRAFAQLVREATPAERPVLAARLRNAGATEAEIASAGLA